MIPPNSHIAATTGANGGAAKAAAESPAVTAKPTTQLNEVSAGELLGSIELIAYDSLLSLLPVVRTAYTPQSSQYPLFFFPF